MTQADAQTFTTLHNFPLLSGGSGPEGVLISPDGKFYGSTRGGGDQEEGTIFSINMGGDGFATLHNFSASSGSYPYTNDDGTVPNPPILSGNVLYGTALQGGIWGYGTVYRVNVDGSGFTNLHSFTAAPGFGAPNDDGANPYGRLVLSGNALYGTASAGGASGSGVVFKLRTDGTGFTNLFSFPGLGAAGFPLAGLTLSGNLLYGTTSVGGSPSAGTVFALNTDGSGFVKLHTFAPGEGAYPQASLLLSSNTLYGTTLNGGGGGVGRGTVFKVNTDASGFLALHTFVGFGTPLTNLDGGLPNAGLTLSGNILYGTASQGGTGSWGTVFAVNTDGTGFKVLHDLNGASDGAYPNGGLLLADNVLYGTASGGSLGNGTIFSITLPRLMILPLDGSEVLLTWPANVLSLNLLCTTNLSSPVWTLVYPGPVTLNGIHVVTNSLSGPQKYFQLSQ
jgi:uncharacterized repeat protein (TIGR03803 family)